MGASAVIEDLVGAGFSRRAATNVVSASGIQSAEELRTAPWGSAHKPGELHWRLLMHRNGGQRLINQVLAFREHGDARQPLTGRSLSVSVVFCPEELEALDRWRSCEANPQSRPAAIRALVRGALFGDR